MREIAKGDHDLILANMDLIQRNKELSKRIAELEDRNRALEAYVASSKAHRKERLLRQREGAEGVWPKLKTGLLGAFNLAVFVVVVMTL